MGVNYLTKANLPQLKFRPDKLSRGAITENQRDYKFVGQKVKITIIARL